MLSVEGKIYLAVVAKKVTEYMLKNKYVETAMQTRGIPGFSGCLEHNSVIIQLIREARENKGNLALVWLDLANTYGREPHKLIEEAMKKYHVPNKVQITEYFNKISVRFTVQEFTTNWQRLEKRNCYWVHSVSDIIHDGCQLVDWFSTQERLNVESPCVGVLQPSGRGFMVDLR